MSSVRTYRRFPYREVAPSGPRPQRIEARLQAFLVSSTVKADVNAFLICQCSTSLAHILRGGINYCVRKLAYLFSSGQGRLRHIDRLSTAASQAEHQCVCNGPTSYNQYALVVQVHALQRLDCMMANSKGFNQSRKIRRYILGQRIQFLLPHRYILTETTSSTGISEKAQRLTLVVAVRLAIAALPTVETRVRHHFLPRFQLRAGTD